MWRMASLKWRVARRQPRELEDETEVHVPARTQIIMSICLIRPNPCATTRRESRPTNDHHRPAVAVREVRSVHLGGLITARGIVTRVSEVKPLLLVNAYTCDVCGSETFQEISRKEFTPIADCQNEKECKRNNIKGGPSSCRSYSSIDDRARQWHLGGIFLPIPYTGSQAVRAGLLTDTYPEAHYIHQLKKQYNEMEVTAEMRAAIIERLRDDPTAYQKLAFSIAPEIYGHVDAKRALLLLLVGGVTKTMGDGIKIRGDLNVCLMGDPGGVNSQLLKYISKVAPRGVYTTEKGSSGVGLMAAVMREPVTDEMVLESGALVWADNGICGVDEFGKMDESDRTAIHEVMEQQTIFISKAGILNARTSILAAANPLYGRYNPKVSPVENINLPAALLSRFYLLLLLLDKPSCDDDERLAQHITHVHMYNRRQDLEYEPLEPALMRAPLSLPTCHRRLVHLRKQSKDDAQRDARTHTRLHGRSSAFCSMRRQSCGCASPRWCCCTRTRARLPLMAASKENIHDEDGGDADARDAVRSDTSRVYRIIEGMAQATVAAGTGRACSGMGRITGAMCKTRMGRGTARWMYSRWWIFASACSERAIPRRS
ncbi:MCM2/3/5 family-domain-containing protein [Lactarius deliciosus]|nr:MCM2/3/5 family-domain-containing protein [Lactarius deliciosus]